MVNECSSYYSASISTDISTKKAMDEATCLAEINYFTMKDLDFLAILLGYRLYIYMLSSYPNKYIYIYTDYISLLGNKAHYTGI